MRKQQLVWEKEHHNKLALPSMATDDPTAGLIYFLNFLKDKKIVPPLKVIDIGCGKGRNAVYLAKQGFEVFGMDYIPEALGYTKKQASLNGINKNLQLIRTEIDAKWPFEDSFFDLALDSFSSIDIETAKGREVYKKELLRTLKPSGFALVLVVSADDEWEKELIKKSPGKEKNSTIWPQNKKFQKDYDEKELRQFYKEFAIIKLKKVSKLAFKLGKDYKATNFWLILRKK